MGCYTERILPHLTNAVMNTGPLREIRARVCAGLAGEVVEIGFGSGHNLPYLSPAVRSLRAVEPSTVGVRLARERIAAAAAPVEVVGLDGQHIDLPDGSADAVLCTWSLCTIPDPVAAVREVRRLLRPGGQFRFVEHGRSPDAAVWRWQDRLNGLERRIAGGCNLNRDIPGIVEAGGMSVTGLDRYYCRGEPKPWGWTFEGTATPV